MYYFEEGPKTTLNCREMISPEAHLIYIQKHTWNVIIVVCNTNTTHRGFQPTDPSSLSLSGVHRKVNNNYIDDICIRFQISDSKSTDNVLNKNSNRIEETVGQNLWWWISRHNLSLRRTEWLWFILKRDFFFVITKQMRDLQNYFVS